MAHPMDQAQRLRRESLGAGRHHILLVEHLQHGGTHDAKINGEEDEGERHRRRRGREGQVRVSAEINPAGRGVELWALTDHDEIGGQQRAIDAARAVGLPYLTGTEISVTFAGRVVHIVGLGFDHTSTEMAEGLRATRGGREARAREMAVSLAEAGIPGAFEGALKYVGNPELISRTHFARFLVDGGHCADVPEVFRRFLKEGLPGYVPMPGMWQA